MSNNDGKFCGVWKLDKPIYCKKDVSGKVFTTKIGGVDVILAFPICPETYDTNTNSLVEGDLITPIGLFFKNINWGMIHAWPEGLFSVNAIVCTCFGNEEDLQKVYADFPRWKEKLYNLILIDSGDYIQPEQKLPALLQYGNGIYDGIEMFRLELGKPLARVKNCRELEPIKIQLISSEECYDESELKKLFENAGSDKEIVLSYELLIVAYRAVFRHDFRSAIVIAATALEKAILYKIENYYRDNNLTRFEEDKKQHKMLGRLFGWLNELSISIPVLDYQTEILDVRNPTAHEGENHTYEITKKYLENCKVMIQNYCTNVLEK